MQGTRAFTYFASIASFLVPVSVFSVETDLAYKTVDAARSAVSKLPGIYATTVNGWIVMKDAENKTIWTFTSKGQLGHPAVIRRNVVDKDGRVVIETRMLCEASKADCDKLQLQFDSLNQKIVEQVK